MPVCPYCGKKLSFLEAFIIKNKQFFKCFVCKKKSGVNFKPNINKILLEIQLFVAIIFVLALFLNIKFIFLSTMLIIVLIFGFYGLIPGFIILEKIIESNKVKKSDLRADLCKSKIYGENDIFSN